MQNSMTQEKFKVICDRLDKNLSLLQLEETLAGERESGEKNVIYTEMFKDDLFTNYMRADTKVVLSWLFTVAAKGMSAAPIYMQYLTIRVAKYLLVIMSCTVFANFPMFTNNRTTVYLSQTVKSVMQMRCMMLYRSIDTKAMYSMPNMFLQFGIIGMNPYMTSEIGMMRIVCAFRGLSLYASSYLQNSARVRNREFLTFWSQQTYGLTY